MNLKSLRKLLAVGLLTVAGHGWATVSLPANSNPTWQDISSVEWSTDNGSTWGNSALVVGQTVEFKLTMHKGTDGNHYADFAKAWIDLNGDEQFTESETLLFGYHVVNSSWNSSSGPENSVNELYEFTSGQLSVTDAMAGDLWLLARVTCSESLLTSANVTNAWDKQWWSYYKDGDWYEQHFSPTLAYYQGESQLVKLTVNRGGNVPEPGTLALFAIAIAGIGLMRKPAVRV